MINLTFTLGTLSNCLKIANIIVTVSTGLLQLSVKVFPAILLKISIFSRNFSKIYISFSSTEAQKKYQIPAKKC